MIAKIVTGKSFGGAVRYLLEKSGHARMIDSDGVALSDIRSLIGSFNFQRNARPEKVEVVGTDLATYCREKVLTGQSPRHIPPAILTAVAELARQGNNLNQLARIANTQKGMEGIVIRLIGLIEFYERLARHIKRYFYDSKDRNG